MKKKSNILIIQLIEGLWLFIHDCLADHPTSKVCSKCNRRKLLSAFNKDTRYQNEIKYRAECKRCKSKQINSWRELNKDHVNELNRIRNKTPKYVESNRKRSALWKQNNRERYLKLKQMQTWRSRAKAQGISLEQYLLNKKDREQKQSQNKSTKAVSVMESTDR